MVIDKTVNVDVPALVFERVSSASADADIGNLTAVSFELAPGGLTWINVDPDQPLPPFADLALGLVAPDTGCVRYGGHDWQTLDAFQQAAARGTAGVVFETSIWVSNLSLTENILLRLAYHTDATEAALRGEAEQKARVVGLNGLRAARPDDVGARELRLLEWVRALMGPPTLAVLVCPERGAPSTAVPLLKALLTPALAQGTAVLWLSDDETPAGMEAPGGVARYRLSGDRLSKEGE